MLARGCQSGVNYLHQRSLVILLALQCLALSWAERRVLLEEKAKSFCRTLVFQLNRQASSILRKPEPDSPPAISQWKPVKSTSAIDSSNGSAEMKRTVAGILRIYLAAFTMTLKHCV